MCWNQPVSWITFILGTVLNGLFAVLTDKQSRLWYLFFQCIIMVQLGEALIWGDPSGGTRAKIGTLISFFGVWLQPLIGVLLLYQFNIRKELQYIMYTFVAIYICFSIPQFLKLKDNTYAPVVCGANGESHIDFKAWDDGGFMVLMYIISCLFFVICLFPLYPYVSGYLILTLIISQVFYRRVFASIWCWFAVFTPVVCFLTRDLPIVDDWVSYVRK
jgi:hypothetical protein